MPRSIEFSSNAFEQFADWQQNDPKLAKKILELLSECARTPYSGPDALIHLSTGLFQVATLPQ